VVSDDDELHVYPADIREMISDCDKNGWEFITGGFLDRIGEDGEFPLVIFGNRFHLQDFLDIL